MDSSELFEPQQLKCHASIEGAPCGSPLGLLISRARRIFPSTPARAFRMYRRPRCTARERRGPPPPKFTERLRRRRHGDLARPSAYRSR